MFRIIGRLFKFIGVLFYAILQMGVVCLSIGAIAFGVATLLGLFFNLGDYVWTWALYITLAISAFLMFVAVVGTIKAFLTGTEDDLIDGMNNTSEAWRQDRELENERMMNAALRDYHRSKGRFWF
ncbi:MAG: hypothetical protein IJF92_00785 [Bacilli bacterium]|nr:hypothetical protein [Bacilli bacterium]MBQ3307650.1 hypothetical protein [Bacilli bacterium]